MIGICFPERRPNEHVDYNLYATPGYPLQGGLP